MKTKLLLQTACKWLLIAAVLIGLVVVQRARPVKYENIDRYATADVAYADGRTARFDDTSFGSVNRDDVVTLHILLPEQPFFENSSLAFSARNAVTEVRCGDTLLNAYGEDIASRGLMVGRHDFIIPIPDTAWGREMTVILRVTENRAFSTLTDLNVYPSEIVYQFYTDSDPVGVVVALTLLVLGLIGLLGLALSKKRGLAMRNGLSLSVSALLVSLWMISSKGIYSLFGCTAYFWQPLEYISGYALLIPLLLLYTGLATEKPKWKKCFEVLFVIACASFVVAVGLHCLNVVHLNALAGIGNAVLILNSLLMLGFTAAYKPDDGRLDSLLKTGMYIFAAVCLYEVFTRTLFRMLPFAFIRGFPSLISIGALSLLVCMTAAFYADLHVEQRDLITARVKANMLDEVINAIPAGICQLIPDDKFTIVAANGIFCRFIGYQNCELKNEKSDDPFVNLSDSDKAFLHKKVEEIIQGDEPRGEFEFSTRDNDHKPVTVLIRYFYDRDGSGNITVSLFDITDRKRMEETLRIREEDYRLAVEASDHLYFNFDAATKTCAHMFDAEALFGIAEKIENIPESLIELGVCAPESVDDYRKVFRMFQEGIPKGEFCLHLQNVKTHIYRWYSGNYRTVFDSSGAPLHAVVAFKDITEQREREIAYKIHKQQIESRPEDKTNYFELNLTTGICNHIYGAQAKQIIASTSSNWDEMLEYAAQHFVRPEGRAAITEFFHTKHLLELFERGVTEAVREYRGYVPDGSTRWLHASVSITSDERTHEVSAFLVTEDIEEEKAKELERQEERQRSHYYEDAYDKLASSVMYGVCKYSADDDLTIIFANDIFYQIHGYSSQAEAVAAGFTSILFATPPFGKEIVRAAHRDYIEGKVEQRFETEYPTVDANGDRIWILCRGVYSPEEDIFNSSVLNITDRKNAEEQLRVSEERYRLALAQSGKVFFFFDVPTRTMHLSNELAQAFGLPTEVDNMPDNFIAHGLVEPQSVENYRHFYEEIYAGKPTGSTIISCHTHSAPDLVLWYEIAFTSVFNAGGVPQSAVITYEDLQEERANKIAGAWKQLNLLSVPEPKYAIEEYDLTQNRRISHKGGLFAKIPDFVTSYDESITFVLDHFVCEDDVPAYKRFLDRDRLLAMFEAGKAEDSIEYRSLQTCSSPRWTSTSIQMIRDPYSKNILAQLLIMDIHAERSGQIEMAQNYEELKKELETSRIKVMINQMQPHFLYNALSAIQTIVKVDPNYAYRLIYDFTVHLRSSIKALSSDAPIPFTEELKNIRAYLNIEQMRFGASLKVKYEIDCDDFFVVPLSIQPLAENAARHGVYPKGDEGGTVTICTYETADAYVVTVEDDGVGFNSKEILNAGGDSVGLKNLIFRLKSLMNADVTINSKPDVGTKVTVTIPKEGR